MDKKKNVPTILWFSDPVGIDETVLLQGDGFGKDLLIEVGRLEDGESSPAESGGSAGIKDWRTIVPNQRNGNSLKFVLPEDWKPGVFLCRVRTDGAVSGEVMINGPDPWWLQGNLGINGSPGGCLRVFGKSLNFGGESRVLLRSADGGKEFRVKAREASCYALFVEIPSALATGDYRVHVHNGFGGAPAWKEAGLFTIRPEVKWKDDIFSVTDFGADPYNGKDSTPAILKAIKSAGDNGGGIVYFPRGRYRVMDMLEIPPFVTLKGEGMGLVNLFWPDSVHHYLSGKCAGEVVPTLIKGGHSFAVEDLSIYTQGEHHDVIAGLGDDIRICRVRIRAYWLYCLFAPNHEHNGRRVSNEPKGRYGMRLSGSNIKVTDCDVYHSNGSLEINHPRGMLVARNQFHNGTTFQCYGAQGFIFEHNECTGVNWGSSLSLYGSNKIDGDNKSSQHVYFAHNTIRYIYCGDRETVTLDGHGTAYLGSVHKAEDRKIILEKDLVFGRGARAMMAEWNGTTLFVLDGKGACQYRRIIGCEGKTLEIDRPWDVEPDSSSTVCVGKFNGRHLFIGNTISDSGCPFQLYPPNIECIVAENKTYRCGNFNSGGLLNFDLPTWGGMSAEPSWFNQFLDNTVVEGNGWGGGVSLVDGWIGGETVMNIYGFLTEKDYLLPISRCQIVRRHVGENNSSMRIVGAVDNVLVENCIIRNNRHGIEIAGEVERYVKSVPNVRTFSAPQNVLLRNNRFENVEMSHYGNAVKAACIIPSANPTHPS